MALIILPLLSLYLLRTTPENIVYDMIINEKIFTQSKSIIIKDIKYSFGDNIYCGRIRSKSFRNFKWHYFTISKKEGIKIFDAVDRIKTMSLNEMISKTKLMKSYNNCNSNELSFLYIDFSSFF